MQPPSAPGKRPSSLERLFRDIMQRGLSRKFCEALTGSLADFPMGYRWLAGSG